VRAVSEEPVCRKIILVAFGSSSEIDDIFGEITSDPKSLIWEISNVEISSEEMTKLLRGGEGGE
jgi:hypothetical protein